MLVDFWSILEAKLDPKTEKMAYKFEVKNNMNKKTKKEETLMLGGGQKVPWDQVKGCEEAPGMHQGCTRDAPGMPQVTN